MAERLWLPSFFKSGMILQQNIKTLLSGRACPNSEIAVKIQRKPFDNRPVSPADKTYGEIFAVRVTSAGDGFFSCELPPLDASFDPLTVTVSCGKQSKVLTDILVGEIWVTAGQANMQLPLSATIDPKQLEKLAKHPAVRVLVQNPDGLANKRSIYHFTPHRDLAGARWVQGDNPGELSEVSAIAFHFARELHLKLKIPVAVIETALRDTHIHSWLNRTSVDAKLAIREHIEQLGYLRSEQDWNMNKDKTWCAQQPAALFNSKVAPLNGFGARGIVWYNGESDYQYPEYYRLAFKNLVDDWRQIFRPADPRGLGLIMVLPKPQLHGHHRFEQLAEFNEMLCKVRHDLKNPAGIVTVYDLPLDYENNIAEWKSPLHPTGKRPVGERLKTVAMGLMYKAKAPASAPECNKIENVGDKLMLSFDNIGEGLKLIGEADRVKGFAICGPDRVFIEAQAKLLYGLKVLVWHDQIKQPEAVTYAYSDFNHHANLISRDRLPVVPFRSDAVPSRYWAPQEWMHCEETRIWCWPRFEEPDKSGWHPAWRLVDCDGDLQVEKNNKSEGDGSLLFKYKIPGQDRFGLEPVIDYDCQFPPLDFSMFSQLTIDVFNPDRHFKAISLELVTGSKDLAPQIVSPKQTLIPTLRWQQMTYDLDSNDSIDLTAIRRIIFTIEDTKGSGSVYLDNIQLVLRKH